MAKPFRLQALLDHKRQQEEQQMLALAERDAERRRAFDVLGMLHAAEQEQLAHLEQLARAARLDAPGQRDATAYLGRIEASIAAQREVIAEAEARVQEARDALLAILKEQRALERLREQHLEAVAIEERRRDANDADEITSARYARQLQAQAMQGGA